MKLATSIIPTSTDLRPGRYVFAVESVTDERHTDQRRFFKVVNRVAEHTNTMDSTDRLYTERYWIGTEADPDGEDPETQKASVGASLFSRLLSTLGVNTKEDVDTEKLFTAINAKHPQYVARLATKARKSDPNRLDTNIVRYWKLGEMEPGYDDGAPVARGARPNGPVPSANKPIARPAAKPAAALPAGFEIEE